MKARILAATAFALGLACVMAAPSAWAEKPTSGKPAPKAAPKPHATKPPKTTTPKTTTSKGSEAPKAASSEAGKSSKREPPRPAAPSAAHQVVERESRIEFDERMVRGQSAAGAIYLFQRSPSEFKSIVEVPDSFRPRTTAVLTPSKGTP
jgi:hypothetical protein